MFYSSKITIKLTANSFSWGIFSKDGVSENIRWNKLINILLHLHIVAYAYGDALVRTSLTAFICIHVTQVLWWHKKT